MSHQDWRFYGIIGACLLAAGILVALMIGGEVAGPRVAETPSHQGATSRASLIGHLSLALMAQNHKTIGTY